MMTGISLLLLFFLQTACSHMPDKKTGAKRAQTTLAQNEKDPWERSNRRVYSFNDTLDRNLLKPLAKGYQVITPEFVDMGISNFFANLRDVSTMVNNALQFKPLDAVSDLGRIVVNSTLGMGGFFDVASEMGLKKHEEDFGQTLAVWGVGPGPHLHIPLLGPSNLRDAPSRVVDYFLNPIDSMNYSEWVTALELTDQRADLISRESLLDDFSRTDRYATLRDAWQQRREFLISDGIESEETKKENDNLMDELDALE